MIFLRSILLAAVVLVTTGLSAFAEKRVALVIGNSAYENVARLSNPANDVRAMTETLKGAGFDIVDARRDLKINEMRRALRDFSDKARDADVAVIYYAGHGIEVDGTNYLIPIDATLERDIDIFDEAFALDRVLLTIEPAKQLRLVILDACRDNPFAKTMKRTIGSRAIGRGLAKIEPNSPNTLIAFASKAGSTASDGDSKNSPFTSALVRHIAKPGLDLRKAFGFVRDDVLKNTSNRQEPYVYGSLGGDDVPLVPAKPMVAAPTPDANASVRRDYELALQIGTREVWTAFLTQYPDGLYASLAKGQLSRIAAEEARTAATEKARLAEEEKARLRAEGARQAEQAKAAAAAKTAENARIAAEKAKQIEQEKVAAAEKARAEAERLATEKKAEAEKLAIEKAEAAKAADAVKLEQKSQQVAALPPTSEAETKQPLAAAELARALQSELRRVGCNAGAVDGNWTGPSQRSLDLFNKHANMKLDVKSASVDALDAVKGKTGRICPLVCRTGHRADGDRCVKITCRSGYQVNHDEECEKVPDKKPVATRNEVKQKWDAERKQIESAPSKPAASGQIICRHDSGCRPVARGCRLQAKTDVNGVTIGNQEVCP